MTQACKPHTANQPGKGWLVPWEFAVLDHLPAPVLCNSALFHAPHYPSKFKALQDQKLCLPFAPMPLILLNSMHTVGAPDAPHTVQCSTHSGHPKAVADRWVS